MSLRDLLVLIGVILIAVVFIGGFYRMRLAKKRANELHFGLEEVKGDVDMFGSELPNGGARKTGAGERLSGTDKAASKGRRVEPGFSTPPFDYDDENADSTGSGLEVAGREEATSEVIDASRKEEGTGKATDSVLTAMKTPASEQHNKRKIKAESNFMPHELDNEPEELSAEGSLRFNNRTSDRKARRIAKSEPKGEMTEKLSDRPPAKEVVAINVIAKGDQPFDGARLLQSLLNSGMRFGDMSIFHRYANENGTGKIQFSMANGVEPGILMLIILMGQRHQPSAFLWGCPGRMSQ